MIKPSATDSRPYPGRRHDDGRLFSASFRQRKSRGRRRPWPSRSNQASFSGKMVLPERIELGLFNFSTLILLAF
jgi:hypothetical protein